MIKNLRKVFIALTVFSNAVLLAATVIAFLTYTVDAALIFLAFSFTATSISSSVLSLHYLSDGQKDRA